MRVDRQPGIELRQAALQCCKCGIDGCAASAQRVEVYEGEVGGEVGRDGSADVLLKVGRGQQERAGRGSSSWIEARAVCGVLAAVSIADGSQGRSFREAILAGQAEQLPSVAALHSYKAPHALRHPSTLQHIGHEVQDGLVYHQQRHTNNVLSATL